MGFAEDLLHRHIEAFNAGDSDSLLADFAPDGNVGHRGLHRPQR